MSVIIKGGSSSDLATVKPASTAPIATDPALVVTISPNSPAGTVTGTVAVSSVAGNVTVVQPSGSALHVDVDNFPATQAVDFVDTAPATQNVTAQDTNSVSTPQANSQNFITGTPAAGSAASFSVSSQATTKYEVTGTWTGTLTVEQSYDSGTTWVAVGVHQTGSAYTTNNFTANFIGGQNISGATNIRVRATAAWTGTATVKVVTSLNTNTVYVGNSIHISDSTTQTIGATIKAASTAPLATDTALVVGISPNSSLPLPSGAATANNQTTLGSQTTKINDGTNTAAVKAASTAPLATDPALVVGISPNSSLPLPAGAATAANQTTLGSQTTKINDGTNTAAVKAASTAPVAADPALVVSISPNSSPTVNIGPSATSTVTNVAASATAVTLLAANTTPRKGASFYSVSGSATLYLKLGSGATTTTSYTVAIAPNSLYELTLPAYDGIITGIWSAATGSVNITELT